MKVLYISNCGDWSGSSIALRNLLTLLPSMGVEPLVVCNFEGTFTQWMSEHDIAWKIIPYPWNYQPSTRTFRDKLAFFWRIYKFRRAEESAACILQNLCKRFLPDIIHSNNGIISIGDIVAKRLHIPHVWHLREYQDKDFGMTPISSMRSFRKKIQGSHCICITKDIQRYFKLNDGNSTVIYDGVMPQGKSRYCAEKDNYLLFVGRVEASKGIDVLIDAFGEYYKQGGDTELWISGTGKEDYVALQKEKVNKFGITSQVKFLGFRSDVYDLMYKAKAVVVPSRFEGFGFITVEAIFNGAIVIGHNTAGTAEIGNSCPILHLYDTKEQLIVLLKGTEEYLDNILISQEYANDNYTIEVSSRNVFKVYKGIVK